MLYNKTKKFRIINKVRIADTFLKRFIGLMFCRKQGFNYALIFPLSSESRINASIHMLFVFFPIDVLFLDEKKVVVDIRSNLRPFSLNCTPRKPAKYIIELPSGLSEDVSFGDTLAWN